MAVGIFAVASSCCERGVHQVDSMSLKRQREPIATVLAGEDELAALKKVHRFSLAALLCVHGAIS